MREGAKKRLIGALVLVTLAVIFVPMWFEPESSLDTLPPIQESMSRAPGFDPKVQTEVFLRPEDSGVGGINETRLTVSEPLALPAAGDAGAGGAAATMPRPAAVGAAKPPKAEPPTATAIVPPRGATDGMPSWVIQVASVATPEGAADLERKLRAGGFTAFVEKATVNGKVYYRVRVGPELDRARAEQTAARLRERHKVNTLITNYP
ncbi:SPOR domain-containing protein [uncultured Lamprocystis sp.]|jgi:DedD protein|uniref:SPOR domain-containing protein n=1 Tax=uncultured Lamprocystis sp. TaxID=543132 RepID=UPI0025D6517C|nr:SPOR domain-containing protein [uncultured Lamprocystis sp.]